MTSVSTYRATRVRRIGVRPDTRDIRIVHEVDGILGQVHPDQLLDTGHALWHAWNTDPARATPDLLLGLDAGGILPTISMALASGLPYRLAWKLDLDLPDKHKFTEPHAHRVEVFTYGNLAGRSVLLVDDEVTTGRTLANLAAVLRNAGVDVTGAACLIEDSTAQGRSLLADHGVPLCALTVL